MARKKQETLVLFPDVLGFTRKFTDAQFGALIRAAFAYRFGGDEYSGDDAAVDVAFQTIVGQIERYQEYCQKQSNNAKGGGVQPMTAKHSQMQPPESESTPSDPPYPYPYPCPSPYPIMEGKAGKPPTRTRFSPPSVQDVAGYCEENGYTVDAPRFVDYYDSVGWRVGKHPMKDWRAAVRNWARNGSQQSAAPEAKNCGYILAPLEDPFEAAMRGRDNV